MAGRSAGEGMRATTAVIAALLVPPMAATGGSLRRSHPEPGPRLYIVSPVNAERAEKAAALERLWAGKLGPDDRYINVCGYKGSGCRATIAGSLNAAPHGLPLRNLVELPRTYAGYFPGGRCSGRPELCEDPYAKASMKFVAGLVEQVRTLKAEGRGMPQWWLLKDDDTYVNAPNLMAAVNESGVDPGSPVAFCHFSDRPVGGGGVLLSGPLAELLALRHGEAWIRSQAEAIKRGGMGMFHDKVLGDFLGDPVPEARLLDLPAMQSLRLDTDPCTELINPPCSNGFRLKHCLCARSPRPATWHLRFSSSSTHRPGSIPFEKVLEYLDDT